MNARRRAALALAPFELLACGALILDAAGRWVTTTATNLIDPAGRFARDTSEDDE